MSSIRAGVHRVFGQRALAFSLALTAVILSGSQSAFAGLIFNQVRLDGQVRSNGGSGATAGVEKHFTNDDFPAPNTGNSLPAEAPAPPSPLLSAYNLNINYDYV